MKRRIALFILLFLPLATISCASGSASGSSKASTTSNSRVLDEQAIQKTGYPNAYQVVAALRPMWIRERAATSFGSQARLKVYLDSQLMGGVDALRQIPTTAIVSMQYLDGMEASNRWGLDHGAGAIVITTK